MNVTSRYFDEYDDNFSTASAPVTSNEQSSNSSSVVAANAVEACAVSVNATFHAGVENFDSQLKDLLLQFTTRSTPHHDDNGDGFHGNGVESQRQRRKTKHQRTGSATAGVGSKWHRNADESATATTIRRFTAISNETGRCAIAQLSPPGFVFRSAGWDCPGNLVLDRRRWICTTLGMDLLYLQRRGQRARLDVRRLIFVLIFKFDP